MCGTYSIQAMLLRYKHLIGAVEYTECTSVGVETPPHTQRVSWI